MTISLLIVFAILIMFGPKKLLHYVIVGLLGWTFPAHFLVAVLAIGIVYYLYKILLARFSWLKRFF
jgi:hypothetical protein